MKYHIKNLKKLYLTKTDDKKSEKNNEAYNNLNQALAKCFVERQIVTGQNAIYDGPNNLFPEYPKHKSSHNHHDKLLKEAIEQGKTQLVCEKLETIYQLNKVCKEHSYQFFKKDVYYDIDIQIKFEGESKKRSIRERLEEYAKEDHFANFHLIQDKLDKLGEQKSTKKRKKKQKTNKKIKIQKKN